ncbi:MAG TPA: hypothetical protein VN728_10920 [Stellaceae bacterium]|jgi:hypothetical protein|nr:hypothetical protein [Stellaceae bacterium]
MKVPLRHTALIAAVVSVASFAAISGARADTDQAKEVSTAATHAGLAAKATDMKMTQTHLQHVVNCLVGPKGKGFDAAPGNPCKDQGNGAIADTKDKKQKATLNQALAKARSGLKAKDMAAAQKDATQIQTMLTPKA